MIVTTLAFAGHNQDCNFEDMLELKTDLCLVRSGAGRIIFSYVVWSYRTIAFYSALGYGNVHRMDPSTRHFLTVQLAWIGISLAISILLSVLLPFPVNLIAILGVFIGLSYYQRRRMLRRMDVYDSQVGYMSPGPEGFSGVNYYCLGCGIKHKEISCPKCGSKMKRAGY